LSKELGKNIIKLREEKYWSREELSNYTSIDLGTITSIENGIISPSNSELSAIANSFNVTVDYLLGYTSTTQFTRKDERDVQKIVKELLADAVINKVNKEDIKLLKASFENVARKSKLLAKQKFTPKKYRK